jgi:dihydrofolate reductase
MTINDASKGAMPLGDIPTDMIKGWSYSKIVSGDITEEINRLKHEPGKDILAHGGAGFARSLVSKGLVDEYRLLTHPVALGVGLPLFSNLPEPLHLRLENVTTFGSGAVAHTYRPQGW